MTKKRKMIITGCILCLVSIFIYTYKFNYNSRGYINCIINKAEGKTLNGEFKTKIKSANLSTDYKIDQVLKDIDTLNLNTLNVPVAINIDNINSNEMQIDKNSEEKAVKLIKKLRFKKINIILEPYPWIENGKYGETLWKPNDINKFFYNWENNVLKPLIDDVAVPCHVDAFNIATSFVHMENCEGYMCDMVEFVRKYYKGLITYRTNFWITAEWKPELKLEYEKKINNKVFSKIDFISIASYFELTDNDTNTVDNLVKSLKSTQIYNRKQNVVQEIKYFHEKWNKPVFFGELGFPRTNKASVQPYNPYLCDTVNNKEQANCFEAYRETFENENWNLGFSIFAIGEKSSDKRYYPSYQTSKVIRDWYSK